jgi:hypothetical protein
MNTKIHFLLIFLFFATCASGEVSKLSIERFLFEIKNNSPQFKITNSENSSSLILKEKENLIFKLNGFLLANHTDQKSPPTSPFSSSSRKKNEYGFGVSKLWETGFNSEVNYTISDVSDSFFSGNKNVFITPKLELILTSNVFQDLFNNRYEYLNEEINKNIESIKINNKVSQKKILTDSLVGFASLLEQKEELGLQKLLCEKSRVQSEKLNKKRKRRSVSNREYFLSLRESTVCQATVEELSKKYYENQNKFEATYNISFKSYESIQTGKIFSELETYYNQLQSRKDFSADIEQKDEVKYLTVLLDAAKTKQQKLDALSKPNLALEVKAGATGLDSSLADANQDVTKLEYPFLYVGLKLDLPWSDREALAEANANQYKIKAIQEQYKLTKSQSSERYGTLNSTLKSDFSIYKKYLNATDLSKKIMSEARKDFNNGRIDFFSLTEFNKSLIQDQKILSSYRIQLIVRMVEFLDFYNYFDKYF